MKKLIIPLIIIAGLGILVLPRLINTPTGTDGALVTAEEAADFFNQENRLVIEKGSAEISSVNGETKTIEVEAAVGIGDTIRVSEEGSATLYWFDDSISRLDAGTEITIAMADYNPESISETHVDFEVVSGNVWSKVQNLVDENSTFTSRSGEVAAGVRGTSFNFRVDGDDIVVEAITHATVVTQGGDSATVVAGDQASMGKFEKKFAAKIENMPSNKLSSEWFAMNNKADVEDAARIKAEAMKRLEERVGDLSEVENKLKFAEGFARIELEVAAAKLRIGSLILSMDREGTDGKDIELIAREVKRVQALIAEEGLPSATKQALFHELATELKLVDRILADVLPDNERFYNAKDRLRQMTYVHLEGDAKEKYDKRMAYRRLFELHDSLLKGWTLACYQDQLNAEFRLRAANDPEFRRVLIRFSEDVKAMCQKDLQMTAQPSDQIEWHRFVDDFEATLKLDMEFKKDGETHEEGVMIQIDPPTLTIPARTAR